MTTFEWLIVATGALLLGCVIGGWAMVVYVRKRAIAEKRRLITAMDRKHGAALNQMRAVQLRMQAELDQTRNNFKRQMQAALQVPEAELARANRRLQFAYSELDRLRAQLDSASKPRAPRNELLDGFALTLPMRSVN